MRWTETGKIISDKKTIIYSGLKTTHNSGVGFILNAASAHALIGWEPVNERIITARFQTKHFKMTAIQIYAPTEDASEQDKDKFYEQVQDIIDKTPRRDIKILLGDMNAQIDKDRKGIEMVIDHTEQPNTKPIMARDSSPFAT